MGKWIWSEKVCNYMTAKKHGSTDEQKKGKITFALLTVL